jgi:predicted nucleic acid-binding protein
MCAAILMTDEVLALAIAAKVELVVSGDNDLLSLGSFEGVPIIGPAEAIALVEATDKT